MKIKEGTVVKLATVLLMLLMVFSWSSQVEAQEQIVFSDFNWDSVQVHNRIAGFVAKHAFGLEPVYEFGETVPLVTGLRRGDVDVSMEMWVDNTREIHEEAMDAGEMIDLGPNFPDSPQGWYIPTFVIEGDEERGIEPIAPDLKSVFDLADHWELFRDPENPDKGRFYNAPPGWIVHDINIAKFEAYGLEEHFEIFNPGSDAALATAFVTAYQRGEPIIGYYWEPTWLIGLLDLTMLEEPPFDPEQWEENRGTAFNPCPVHIAINPSLVEKSPQMVSFLAHYETTMEQNNEILAYIREEEASIEEAALWFFDNYRHVWHQWFVQDSLIEKIEAAVAEELGN